MIALFRYVALATDSLAGKKTELKGMFELFASMGADRWVAYIVATVTTGAYANERRLRKHTVSDKDTYIKELEARIDPKRSSSGLTSTGEPHKEKHDAH